MLEGVRNGGKRPPLWTAAGDDVPVIRETEEPLKEVEVRIVERAREASQASPKRSACFSRSPLCSASASFTFADGMTEALIGELARLGARDLSDVWVGQDGY